MDVTNRNLQKIVAMNQKFYTHVTLELANTQAMIGMLMELVKSHVVTSRDFDPAEFQAHFEEKLKEFHKSFQEAALEALGKFDMPNIETDSENN